MNSPYNRTNYKKKTSKQKLTTTSEKLSNDEIS